MALHIKNLTKSYSDSDGTVLVLQGVSLDLAEGQTLALTGESGSGKSTLLHIAAGLEAPDSGSVVVGGNDLTQMDDKGRAALRRKEIALVFQQFNLIPSLTVEANITFQARLSDRVDKPHIDALVKALGLENHLHKYPETLSGGQQQRVAIARALAAKPALLLADEPTGNLDEGTAQEVLGQMLQLVTETGAAMMVVTHSPQVAAQMDRQVHLTGGTLA